MQDFKNKNDPISNLKNGISSLQIALAAKKAMKSNKKVKLVNFL